MKQLLLGIDIGTNNCKVGIYDNKGLKIASGYKSYKFDITPQGAAEVDAMVWVSAMIDGLKEALAQAQVKPQNIIGIAVSGTNGLVPVKKDGTPLRPALMLMDRRSQVQVEEIANILGWGNCFNRTGNNLIPGMVSSPLILWIKENEPRIYKKTYKFLVPAGFVNMFLTGKATIDMSRASMTILFDQIKGDWIIDFCNDLNIDVNKLPDICESFKVIGYLNNDSAKIMGLTNGIPIIAGCTDTVAASVGAGAVGDRQSYMILGSTGRICITTKESQFHPKFVNTCHVTRNRWIHSASMNSSGLSLKWIKSLLDSKDYYSYEDFISIGTKIPISQNVLYFLPYLAGERSPIWDSKAKGLFFGFSLDTNRNDFVRAVLDGVGYAFADNIEILEQSYGKLGLMKFGGGGTQSIAWPQIIADITGKELAILENPDLETAGCALIAGFGTGLYSDLEETSKFSSKIKTKILPRNDIHKIHIQRLKTYRQLYSDLQYHFSKEE